MVTFRFIIMLAILFFFCSEERKNDFIFILRDQNTLKAVDAIVDIEGGWMYFMDSGSVRLVVVDTTCKLKSVTVDNIISLKISKEDSS